MSKTVYKIYQTSLHFQKLHRNIYTITVHKTVSTPIAAHYRVFFSRKVSLAEIVHVSKSLGSARWWSCRGHRSGMRWRQVRCRPPVASGNHDVVVVAVRVGATWSWNRRLEWLLRPGPKMSAKRTRQQAVDLSLMAIGQCTPFAKSSLGVR